MKSIRQIETLFPADLANKLEAYVANAPYKYGWPSNKNIGYSHWNYSIVKGGALNGLEVADKLPPLLAEAWEHLQKHYLGEQTLIRCYTNAHTFGVEGYPHTDSIREHDHTVVVYMNREWKREWGGETMLYDGYNIVHAELPKFNKGLVFKGNQYHTARSVSRICPELRRTLMFKFAPKNIDPKRDRIQSFLTHCGADDIKHSGRNLSVHLLSTYDILKAGGYDDITCAAGGLHSIFGTNIFQHEAVSTEHRDIVTKIFNEEVIQLVELFRDIKRPGTLEEALKNNTLIVETNDGKTKELNKSQLNSLCAIEAANLSDQKSLKNWPHISKFKR